MRLETSTVISELEEMGIDAHVCDDGHNSAYLHVEGSTFNLEVIFGTEVEETLDLDYLDSAYRWNRQDEPWNHYTVDFREVNTLEEFLEAVDKVTR